MSRLIKNLNCVRKPEPEPMGFGFMATASSPKKSRMQILVNLKADLLEKISDNLKPADALLIDASTAAELKAVEKLCQDEKGTPAGRWLRDTSEKALKKALESACDFIVFNPSTPVEITANEKIGRVLELDIALDEGLLRAVSDLPVDAVLLSLKPDAGPLTLQNLMQIQRLVYLVNKPLIISVPEDIGSSGLQSLWDMGICGVLIEITGEKSASCISDILQKIEKLGPPAFRKKSKAKAILPQTSSTQAEPEEDDDEEEEEDE